MSERESAKPTRRVLHPGLAAIFIVIALAGISVAVYFVSSGSPKGQSAASAKPASGTGKESRANTSAVPGPMPGAPTVKVSPVASVTTPKPLKPSDPAQVKSWNAGDGGATLTQVTEDSGSLLIAYGSGEYTETLQGCTALAGAVEKAVALPPIPDTAMQKLYVKSLDAFRSGITECEAAITQHPEGVEDDVTDVNHAEMNTAISQFSVGTKDLYIATEALRTRPKKSSPNG
jgi:hypothetical protein